MSSAGKFPAVAIAASLLSLLAVACASDRPEQAPSQNEGPTAAAEPPFRPDRVPLIEGPVSAGGLRAILGTADLGLGPNRVGFVLTHANGFVTAPGATVFSTYRDGAEDELGEVAAAEFQPWPYGKRGLYSTELDFDKPGNWELDIAVEGPDGTLQKVRLSLDVAQAPAAPAVGAMALRSESRTVADVESLAQLSTGLAADPDLYRTTIANAVVSGVPTVVVFASPAFCTNAVCGPQVEVLRELKDMYGAQANFIHVDLYDNPDEIQGDLERARISPIVYEWGLPSNEWTFVIDRKGIVSSRFEAFATLAELEEALLKVL